MEDSLIPLNVVVGDRTYRIRIEPAHEEIVRKIVKIINDKLLDFKTNFAGKDMQDYIAMVVLWYATKAAEESGDNVGGEVADKISALETMIDRVLESR